MSVSFADRLRWLWPRPRKAGPLAQAAIASPRPEGPLIWIVVDPAPEIASGAGLLLRRLTRARPGTTLVVSLDAARGAELPPRVIRIDPIEETGASIRAVLGHWRPDLIVLMGNILSSDLLNAAEVAGIPVMAVDMRVPGTGLPGGMLRRNRLRGLLDRLARINVRDGESQAVLRRYGLDPARIEVGGVLSDPPEPLRCSEAERASIATLTRTRPVWLAAAVPAAEIRMVLDAHAQAARHAHRMLLILAPEEDVAVDGLVQDLEAEGWVTGRRTAEGEPEAEMQIFLADDPGDYGLWFRIAPVTYMGGTVLGGGGGRSPLDAAALGSAILHGAVTAAHAADYARLDEARAARTVADATSLGEAVSDLMAPDRAAMLAHNAWAVTSGGAGAAEAVARAILAQYDAGALIATETR